MGNPHHNTWGGKNNSWGNRNKSSRNNEPPRGDFSTFGKVIIAGALVLSILANIKELKNDFISGIQDVFRFNEKRKEITETIDKVTNTENYIDDKQGTTSLTAELQNKLEDYIKDEFKDSLKNSIGRVVYIEYYVFNDEDLYVDTVCNKLEKYNDEDTVTFISVCNDLNTDSSSEYNRIKEVIGNNLDITSFGFSDVISGAIENFPSDNGMAIFVSFMK